MILASCLVNNFVRNFVVSCWMSSFLMWVLLIVLGLLLIVLCFVVLLRGGSWWTGACPSLGKWPQHAKFWMQEFGFRQSEALYDSMVFWPFFWIIMHHLTIQSQRSNSVKTLREIWKSWNRFYMVNSPTDTGANPWVPHVVDQKSAAPSDHQRHSDRSVQESCKQWAATIRPGTRVAAPVRGTYF